MAAQTQNASCLYLTKIPGWQHRNGSCTQYNEQIRNKTMNKKIAAMFGMHIYPTCMCKIRKDDLYLS